MLYHCKKLTLGLVLVLYPLANEHHETAKSLETAIRGKALPEQIITDLSMFPLQARSEPLSPLTRSIAIQTLLNTGSRSFSHFLNATERYLPVLRQLAETEAARIDILRNVSQFWRTSGQWRLIITDKLMQYGIVGGVDVVRFLFELDDGVLGRNKVSEEWMSGQRWDVLRNAVDKIGGRVVADRRRIVGLEEAEEKRTVMSGAVPEGMDVDKETTAPELAEGKRANPHMAVALSALSSHQQTHKQTLVLALESFVGSLLPSNADEGLAGLIKKGGWKGRESWDEGDWIAWSHWGWYREFCRLVRRLRSHCRCREFSSLTPNHHSLGSTRTTSLPTARPSRASSLRVFRLGQRAPTKSAPGRWSEEFGTVLSRLSVERDHDHVILILARALGGRDGHLLQARGKAGATEKGRTFKGHVRQSSKASFFPAGDLCFQPLLIPALLQSLDQNLLLRLR